jgi:hypothetical protein
MLDNPYKKQDFNTINISIGELFVIFNNNIKDFNTHKFGMLILNNINSQVFKTIFEHSTNSVFQFISTTQFPLTKQQTLSRRQ